MEFSIGGFYCEVIVSEMMGSAYLGYAFSQRTRKQLPSARVI